MGVMVHRSRAWRCAAPGLALLLTTSTAGAVPRRAPASLPVGPSPVTFAIEPVPGTWQWRWSIRNVTDAAVEIAADHRLVWFEVPPPPPDPAAPRRRARRAAPVRCVFEARPANAEAAARTELRPGERYSELVDLRDVCRLRVPAAMTPGALVVAHYGFAPLSATGRPRPTRARWMARTLLLDANPYPVNDLTATVAVPEGEPPTRASATPRAGTPTLVGHDAQSATGEGLRASLRLRNETARPFWTLLRTVQFSFEVETPSGRAVTCDAVSREPAPFREFFVRLGAGASRGVRLAPFEYCPIGTFQEAGLYRARAVFRTTANGEPWLRGEVFTGRVESEPFLFRVWRGNGRYWPSGLQVSG